MTEQVEEQADQTVDRDNHELRTAERDYKAAGQKQKKVP